MNIICMPLQMLKNYVSVTLRELSNVHVHVHLVIPGGGGVLGLRGNGYVRLRPLNPDP